MQVWVEVQHCEERVQLLCTITRAVETHVSILQEELCKVTLILYCLSPLVPKSQKPTSTLLLTCRTHGQLRLWQESCCCSTTV